MGPNIKIVVATVSGREDMDRLANARHAIEKNERLTTDLWYTSIHNRMCITILTTALTLTSDYERAYKIVEHYFARGPYGQCRAHAHHGDSMGRCGFPLNEDKSCTNKSIHYAESCQNEPDEACTFDDRSKCVTHAGTTGKVGSCDTCARTNVPIRKNGMLDAHCVIAGKKCAGSNGPPRFVKGLADEIKR